MIKYIYIYFPITHFITCASETMSSKDFKSQVKIYCDQHQTTANAHYDETRTRTDMYLYKYVFFITYLREYVILSYRVRLQTKNEFLVSCCMMNTPVILTLTYRYDMTVSMSSVSRATDRSERFFSVPHPKYQWYNVTYSTVVRRQTTEYNAVRTNNRVCASWWQLEIKIHKFIIFGT